MNLEIVLFILGIILTIIGYLLSQKDSKQQKEIDILFKKHDIDALALQELRERVVGNHYERRELDVKFDKLETSINVGLEKLGNKFDEFNLNLLKYLESSNKDRL